MASRYVIAFSALLALAAGQGFIASPLCDSWTPLGEDFQPEDTLGRTLSCTPSADGKSIDLTVEVTDPEKPIIHLMAGVVFADGKGVPGGVWEPLPENYRTMTCADSSPRVMKVDDAKDQTTTLTYIFAEDAEVSAGEVSCRFFLADSDSTYWEDQTVTASGEQDAPDAAPLETTTGVLPTGAPATDLPTTEPLPTEAPTGAPVPTGTPGEETTPDVPVQTAPQTFEQTTEAFPSETSGDGAPVAETSGDGAPVAETSGDGAPVAETSGDGAPITETEFSGDVAPDTGDFAPDTGSGALPSSTEPDTGSGALPSSTEPDTGSGALPSSTEPGSGSGEFQNEPEVLDANLVEQDRAITVGDDKSSYWCEDSGNTYVMASGTDCRMFYQGIIKEGSDELSPLGTFSCSPGSRFHTTVCTCVMYDNVNCPDADPSFEPPNNPIPPGKEDKGLDAGSVDSGSGETPEPVATTTPVAAAGETTGPVVGETTTPVATAAETTGPVVDETTTVLETTTGSF